jgi:peptidoglycan/LPS O-acetylase OafA/YrhL
VSTQTAAVALRPTSSPVSVVPRRRRPQFGLLGHAPGLDGLRGLAVLLIMTYHFVGHYVLKGAWASLDMFFALSGFLITALILDEVRVHGRVDLRLFYARRALRLLPALFAMLAVWIVLLLLFHDSGWFAATPSSDGSGRSVDVGGALRDVGVALVYFANWNVISGGMEAPLSHLWSLAVEEQFYIVWPTLLLGLLLLARRPRLALVGLTIAASAALPWLVWNGGAGKNHIYFGTDTRAASLLAGAFAALVWHERHAAGRVARFPAARAWVGVAVMAWAVVFMTESWAKYVVIPAVTALCVSQLVPFLADNRPGALTKAFSWRPLVWVGKRSYALYLWHYLWATWTHPMPLWVGVPLGVAGAFACTWLSWRWVETPALAYSRRFRVSTAPSRAERAAA